MAHDIIWSVEAYDDIDQIAAFISRDSAYHAHSVVEKILQASRSLGQLPERGRIVPEMDNPAVQELFVFSYRLIYEIDEHRILVLAVIHGHRLLAATGRFS